jgi:hypothetical protein
LRSYWPRPTSLCTRRAIHCGFGGWIWGHSPDHPAVAGRRPEPACYLCLDRRVRSQPKPVLPAKYACEIVLRKSRFPVTFLRPPSSTTSSAPWHESLVGRWHSASQRRISAMRAPLDRTANGHITLGPPPDGYQRVNGPRRPGCDHRAGGDSHGVREGRSQGSQFDQPACRRRLAFGLRGADEPPRAGCADRWEILHQVAARVIRLRSDPFHSYSS